MKRLKLSDFKLMFVMLGVFAAVAVGFWRAFGNIFYLYNFGIIGVSVGLGMGLWPLLGRERKPWARRLSQVLVGGYMFFGLGLGLVYLGLCRGCKLCFDRGEENCPLEGDRDGARLQSRNIDKGVDKT